MLKGIKMFSVLTNVLCKNSALGFCGEGKRIVWVSGYIIYAEIHNWKKRKENPAQNLKAGDRYINEQCTCTEALSVNKFYISPFLSPSLALVWNQSQKASSHSGILQILLCRHWIKQFKDTFLRDSYLNILCSWSIMEKNSDWMAFTKRKTHSVWKLTVSVNLEFHQFDCCCI